MSDKERIDYIIEYSSMNMSAFARYIGLKGAHVFYDIRSGKNGISKDLARKIHAKLPQFNLSWILTGKGEIFYSEENQLLKEKEEAYKTDKMTISQKDFSALLETVQGQQKTIEIQAETINRLTIIAENNGTIKNSNV